MKAAYFSYFIDDIETERKRFEMAAQAAGADELVAIIGGNYLQNGLPIVQNPDEIVREKNPAAGGIKYEGAMEDRLKKAQQIGLKEVLVMPEYSSLASIGIFASSAVNMISEDGFGIDAIVFETENADIDLLHTIAMLRIKNAPDFKNTLTKYKESGMPFYAALAKTMGKQLEGSEPLMQSPENILAIESLMAMKYRYSQIKSFCMPKLTSICRDAEVDDSWNAALRQMLYEPENTLSDTYGGFERMTREILAARDQFHDLKQFAKLLTVKGRDEIAIRKYLLRLVRKVRKLDVITWQMYDFTTGAKRLHFQVFDSCPMLENCHIRLRQIWENDRKELESFIQDETAYRFAPEGLYERNYLNAKKEIDSFFGECFFKKEAIFLGIFDQVNPARMHGIVEIYHYEPEWNKISVGLRLTEESWKQGLGEDAIKVLTEYYFAKTNITAITAHVNEEDALQCQAFEACGYTACPEHIMEDWGLNESVKTKKYLIYKREE